MVIGIGLDIVEIARVERLLERYGERFIRRLMRGPEAAALPPKGATRTMALAFSIAAKEATSKALGTGWSGGVTWSDVVVSILPAPAIRLERRAAEVAAVLGSKGRVRLRLEERGALALAEAWLLS